MFIRFMCPACGRRAKAPADRAGTVGKCVTCGALVRVPQAAPTADGLGYVGSGSSSSAGVAFEDPFPSHMSGSSASLSASSAGQPAPPDSYQNQQAARGVPFRGEFVDGRTPLTATRYIGFIRKSGLVDAAALDQVLVRCETNAHGKPLTIDAVAAALVQTELLTPWQDRMLRQGLYEGFFLGRYKLLRELGAGGMGCVYLAEHSMLRRLVAIKVLHGNNAAYETQLARFYRESQTTAQLDHPNVVRVFDFDTNGKLYYLILEYVDGPNLQELVNKEGPLPYALAANYMSQAAAGLNYAHEIGLVHRDVKPPNLLLNPKGIVKISDLGLARMVNHEGPSVTVTEGGVLGTTDFLAPEQAIDSSKVDCRADVYSLGCTMFFLLTGRPPFATGTMAQRLLMHQMQQPPRLKDFRPDCPDELQVVCDQMMAKSPETRPSAARVRQMLALFVAKHTDPRLARLSSRKVTESMPEMAPPENPSSLSIDGPKRFPLPPKLP